MVHIWFQLFKLFFFQQICKSLGKETFEKSLRSSKPHKRQPGRQTALHPHKPPDQVPGRTGIKAACLHKMSASLHYPGKTELCERLQCKPSSLQMTSTCPSTLTPPSQPSTSHPPIHQTNTPATPHTHVLSQCLSEFIYFPFRQL